MFMNRIKQKNVRVDAHFSRPIVETPLAPRIQAKEGRYDVIGKNYNVNPGKAGKRMSDKEYILNRSVKNPKYGLSGVQLL